MDIVLKGKMDEETKGKGTGLGLSFVLRTHVGAKHRLRSLTQ
ncbi:MAG: hypothetical protein AAB067_03905 [Planctomycetota bacterium]